MSRRGLSGRGDEERDGPSAQLAPHRQIGGAGPEPRAAGPPGTGRALAAAAATRATAIAAASVQAVMVETVSRSVARVALRSGMLIPSDRLVGRRLRRAREQAHRIAGVRCVTMVTKSAERDGARAPGAPAHPAGPPQPASWRPANSTNQ